MEILEKIKQKLEAESVPREGAPTVNITRSAYERLLEQHRVHDFEQFDPDSSPPKVYGCPIEVTEERMPDDVVIRSRT